MRPVTIEDIVQTDVVTAERDAPVTEAVGKMAENDVGAVVVVEDDRPVGVLTDRKVALSLQDMPDITQVTAGELVSEGVVTGTNAMTVFEALQRLDDENVRRLPIVDNEDETLEGIVTLDDILVLLGTELKHATDIIQAQSPRL